MTTSGYVDRKLMATTNDPLQEVIVCPYCGQPWPIRNADESYSCFAIGCPHKEHSFNVTTQPRFIAPPTPPTDQQKANIAEAQARTPPVKPGLRLKPAPPPPSDDAESKVH